MTKQEPKKQRRVVKRTHPAKKLVAAQEAKINIMNNMKKLAKLDDQANKLFESMYDQINEFICDIKEAFPGAFADNQPQQTDDQTSDK